MTLGIFTLSDGSIALSRDMSGTKDYLYFKRGDLERYCIAYKTGIDAETEVLTDKGYCTRKRMLGDTSLEVFSTWSL